MWFSPLGLQWCFCMGALVHLVGCWGKRRNAAVPLSQGQAGLWVTECLIPEPVDKVAALREFRVLHTALHSSSSYREAVSASLCWEPLPGIVGEGCRVGVGSPSPWLPRVPREFLSCLWVSVEPSHPPEGLSQLGIVDSL